MLSRIPEDRRSGFASSSSGCAFSLRVLTPAGARDGYADEATGPDSAEAYAKAQDRVGRGHAAAPIETKSHFIHDSARTFLWSLTAARFPSCPSSIWTAPRTTSTSPTFACAISSRGPCWSAQSISLPDRNRRESDERYPSSNIPVSTGQPALRSPPEVKEMFEPGKLPLFCGHRSALRKNWLKTYWSGNQILELDPPKTFEMVHLAAYFGITTLLRKLLAETILRKPKWSRTALAIFRTKFGFEMTPLHWACRNGHRDCVSALLEYGADSHKPGFGMTPMAWAARNGHADIIKLLLADGASLKAKSYGLTPLHWASLYGKSQAIGLLMERGADVNERGSSHMSKYISTPRVGRNRPEMSSLGQRWKLKTPAYWRKRWPRKSGRDCSLYSSGHRARPSERTASTLAVYMLQYAADNTLFRVPFFREMDDWWLSKRRGTLKGNEVCWAAVTPVGRLKLIWDAFVDRRYVWKITKREMDSVTIAYLVVYAAGILVLAISVLHRYADNDPNYRFVLVGETLHFAVASMATVALRCFFFVFAHYKFILFLVPLLQLVDFYEPLPGISWQTWIIAVLLVTISTMPLLYFGHIIAFQILYLVLSLLHAIIGDILEIRGRVVQETLHCTLRRRVAIAQSSASYWKRLLGSMRRISQGDLRCRWPLPTRTSR